MSPVTSLSSPPPKTLPVLESPSVPTVVLPLSVRLIVLIPLAVQLAQLTEPRLEDLKSTGVYIQTVESSSPADKAGLIEGDKILEVNGVEVTDTTHFKYELYKYKVGETIEIKYERNGSSSKTKVTLGSNSKSA